MPKTIAHQKITRIPESEFYALVEQRSTLLKTEEGLRKLAGVARGGKDWKNDEHYTGLHYALSGLSGSKEPEIRALLLDLFRDPKRREIVASTLDDGGYSAVESALNDDILKDLAGAEEGRQFLLRALRGTNNGNYHLARLVELNGGMVHVDDTRKLDPERLIALAEEAKVKGSAIHLDDYGSRRDARTLDLSQYGHHIGAFGMQTDKDFGLRLAVNEEDFSKDDAKEKTNIAVKAALTDYWSLNDDFEPNGAMPMFGAVQNSVYGAYYAAAAIEYPAILDVNLGKRSSDQPLLDVYNRYSYTLAYHIAVHAPLHMVVRLVEKLNETSGQERRNYLSILAGRITDNVCDSFHRKTNGPSVFDAILNRLREPGQLSQLADEYERKFGDEVRTFDGKGVDIQKPPLTAEAKSTRDMFSSFWGLDELVKFSRKGQPNA